MPPAHFHRPQPLRTENHSAAASHTRPAAKPPHGPTEVIASRSRVAPPSIVHHSLIAMRSGARPPASDDSSVSARARSSSPASGPLSAMASGTAFASMAVFALTGAGRDAVFMALAPVLPMIGVATAYGADADPTYELTLAAPFFVSAYPNAGLPNEFGHYDQTPEQMAALAAASGRRVLLVAHRGGVGPLRPAGVDRGLCRAHAG